MSFLYKKIVYLSYQKEDGSICRSGFARVRKEGDRYRMEIQVSGVGEREGRYPVWLEQEQGEHREIGMLWLKKGAGRGEAECPAAETGWEGQSMRIWIPCSDAEGISGHMEGQRGRTMPEAALKAEVKTSVSKAAGSFVSGDSVPGEAAAASKSSVDQEAALSEEKLSVPRETVLAAEELSVPREIVLPADELSVPREIVLPADEMPVSRETTLSAETELLVSRETTLSAEEAELLVSRETVLFAEESSIDQEAASFVPEASAYQRRRASVQEHPESHVGIQREAGDFAERDLGNPEWKRDRENKFSLKNPGKMEQERLSGKRVWKVKQEQASMKEVILNDKWEQLCQIYTRLHPYEDERVYISIQPRDFVILTGNYQYLANNSFLLHGYYNYQYLILGRERQGQVEDQEKAGEEEGYCFYLGVPGVYYEREKAVARMFGFEAFECAGGCPSTGKFGYYLKRVSI